MTPDNPSTHASVFQQLRDPTSREQGITRLFERYREYVLARCRARGLQNADAEDVTQALLIKLGEKVEGYDPARPFRPWLRVVVANAVEDYRRSQAQRDLARGGSTAAELLAQAPDPDDVPEGDEDREMALLAELVRRVEAEQRPDFEAFWLLHVAGWSTVEIGQKLGKKPNNVSQMAFRGKKWARAVLGRLLDEVSQ